MTRLSDNRFRLHSSNRHRWPKRAAAGAVVAAIASTTLIGGLHHAGAAAAPCTNDWSIDSDTLTIRERDESLGILGNDGDEPYLALVPFRVKPGAANSTTSWLQGADHEPNDDGKAGETFEIPDSMGRATFKNVAPGEVVGVVTLALESDATPFKAVRAGINEARVHINTAMNRAIATLPSTSTLSAQVLRDLTDSNPNNDTAAIDKAVGQVKALPKRVAAEMPSNTSLFLSVVGKFLKNGGAGVVGSGIADPDGFGGASVQVFVNVDPLRSIATNKLVPAAARSQLTKALATLDQPKVSTITAGVKVVVSSLRPQYRRISYSFDGSGFLMEHIDADGRYEVPSMVMKCADGQEPGLMHLDQFGSNGISTKRVDTGDWTSGWSVSEVGYLNGSPFLFNLKEANGRAEILGLPSRAWTRGWTNADIVDVGGSPHLVHYKRASGRLAINRITKNNLTTIGSETHDTTVESGYTSVRAFRTNAGAYVMFLNSNTGKMTVRPLATNGKVGAPVDNRNWSVGWTSAETFTIAGKPYVMIHKSQGGLTEIYAFDANGRVGAKMSSQLLPQSAPGWGVNGDVVDTDTFEIYQVGSKTLMMRVNKVTGDQDVRTITVAQGKATLSKVVSSTRWTVGWTNVETYAIKGVPYRFMLKSGM